MMTKGLGATQRSPRPVLKLLQMLLEAVGPRQKPCDVDRLLTCGRRVASSTECCTLLLPGPEGPEAVRAQPEEDLCGEPRSARTC